MGRLTLLHVARERRKGRKDKPIIGFLYGSVSPPSLSELKTNSIMGLRFSILGFAQERVLEVRGMDGNKELRLDVTDLLLLNQLADFPNRSGVMKIIEDDKIFFWMAYSEIIEELPILCLKKQALRDRFDKLVALGLLEKKIGRVGNMTFFRLTDKYESLKYDTMIYSTEHGDVLNDRGVYSDTQGVCSGLHTITINKYNNNKEKEISKEKDVCDKMPMLFPDENNSMGAQTDKPTAEEMDGWFEELWLAYERKGSKAKARKEFDKLTKEEVATMRLHIPPFLQSRPERQYRPDFERYIKNKVFNSVVYSKANEMLFDPEAPDTSVTREVIPEPAGQSGTITINGQIYR